MHRGEEKSAFLSQMGWVYGGIEVKYREKFLPSGDDGIGIRGALH